MLNEIGTIEPIVMSALNDIVAKKNAFMALPVGGVSSLVLQDLQDLCASIAALAKALIAKSPVCNNSMILCLVLNDIPAE